MSCCSKSPTTTLFPSSQNCPNKDGCIPGVCPDFIITQHDTRPVFKYPVTDDNGDPIDLTGLVLEASMWANARLKREITETDTVLTFVDNIGFYQALKDDVIIMSSVRSPEHMLVTDFDEANKSVIVERGYANTTAQSYKKCTALKIFRFINSPGTTEMTLEDLPQIDGTTLCDQLTESFLVYYWQARDTCLSGCYCFVFNLLSLANSPEIPSVLEFCDLPVGISWKQSYPRCGKFLIKICESPIAE